MTEIESHSRIQLLSFCEFACKLWLTYVNSLLMDQVNVQMDLLGTGETVSPYSRFGRERAIDIIHIVMMTDSTWRLDILGRNGYMIAIYLQVKTTVFKFSNVNR